MMQTLHEELEISPCSYIEIRLLHSLLIGRKIDCIYDYFFLNYEVEKFLSWRLRYIKRCNIITTTFVILMQIVFKVMLFFT